MAIEDAASGAAESLDADPSVGGPFHGPDDAEPVQSASEPDSAPESDEPEALGFGVSTVVPPPWPPAIGGSGGTGLVDGIVDAVVGVVVDGVVAGVSPGDVVADSTG